MSDFLKKTSKKALKKRNSIEDLKTFHFGLKQIVTDTDGDYACCFEKLNKFGEATKPHFHASFETDMDIKKLELLAKDERKRAVQSNLMNREKTLNKIIKHPDIKNKIQYKEKLHSFIRAKEKRVVKV